MAIAVNDHMLTRLPSGHSHSGEVSFKVGETKITLTGRVGGTLRYHPEIEIRLDGRILGTFADTAKIDEPRLRSAVEFVLEALAEMARLAAIEEARALRESKRKIAEAARVEAAENERAIKESLRKL
jgi:hypothetical protein